MVMCWFNLFSGTEEPCPNEGKWKFGGNPTNGIMRESRWCDDHKHSDDIQVNNGHA